MTPDQKRQHVRAAIEAAGKHDPLTCARCQARDAALLSVLVDGPPGTRLDWAAIFASIDPDAVPA